ncbi:PREDICTED: cadherin-23-like, partial [Priapulus caudatus]|uniref:Cadherin-23-like n=1 Tax=Priapulus caudatus TaxID=37621 RepID=A0ABM1EN16_PRICU
MASFNLFNLVIFRSIMDVVHFIDVREQIQLVLNGSAGDHIFKFFAVNATTADVLLSQRLDREVKDYYLVRWSYQDSGQREIPYISMSTQVYVLDVNDNRPEFTLVPKDQKVAVAE